ncbi:hypothetical protein ABIB75_008139 [Bradyrhizobium sp. GM2.2]
MERRAVESDRRDATGEASGAFTAHRCRNRYREPHLPLLRRAAAQDRGDRQGSLRRRSNAVPGQAHCASAVWLPGMPPGCDAGTCAGPGDRWRDGNGSLAGPHRGDEIRLPVAAVSADVRRARHHTRSADAGLVDGPRRLVAEAASHAVARHSDVPPAAVCRRDAAASSRSRPWQDQSLPVLGDRHR